MEIKKAEFITSMAQYGKFEGVGLPQIAVAGKSNVGKSSLINKLCNRRSLARTSQTPGKTRLINAFLLNDSFHLIDLPGYGFAKVDKQEKLRWGKMMQDYFEQSDELRHVLCLVDIRHEPTEDDKQMNLFLRQMGIPTEAARTYLPRLACAAVGGHLLVVRRRHGARPAADASGKGACAGRRSAGSLTRIFHPPHTMGTARRIRLDGGVQQ